MTWSKIYKPVFMLMTDLWLFIFMFVLTLMIQTTRIDSMPENDFWIVFGKFLNNKLFLSVILMFCKFLAGVAWIYFMSKPKLRNHSSRTSSLFLFRLGFDILVINFLVMVVTSKKKKGAESFNYFDFMYIMVPIMSLEYFVVYRMSVKYAIMRHIW